jgi:hypothetical protein
VPPLHASHAALDVAPTALEKVPAGQSAGLAPATQKAPDAHGVHEFSESPVLNELKEPAGHEDAVGATAAAPQK